MKIERVELFQVPPRGLFMKLTTDDGLSGWGETVVEGKAATVEAAVREMEDYLIGQDPRRIEDIWQILYRAGFYRGGPILMSAIAGIDQALWDLKGRFYQLPVYEFLGGAVREKVRVYAWIGGDRPADVGKAARGRVASGFTALIMNLSDE